MRDFKWSDVEKKIARRAFDAAFQKECTAVIQRLIALAVNARRPDDIWAIHDYLTEQRKKIDEKYDYRYSQLIVILGRLLSEKWIEEDDIAGLSDEKLQIIHHIASL